ncbi:hypothetical protein ACIBTV_25745 [Micromonospora sp. NPDC049366]|uniref:hypothetical protein n=1 Tax=Micromonospora sp. NPDC049366 TaxID=3364271 RepID=UPI0037A453F6
MTRIWRDFLAALVGAFRHRPTGAVTEERRRAVQRLAEETIREHRRATDPPK